MSRSRGMTLVEMMVACLLIGLATALLATFFAAFGRQMLRYDRRQELLREADRAVVRIQSVFGDAHAAYTVADTSIAGIYLPVAENTAGALQFDSNGHLLYQAWIAYGLNSTTLYEARQAMTATPSPTLPASLPATWTRSTLCANVKSFTLSGPANGALSISLLVRNEDGYQLQLNSSVVARN